MRRKRSGRAPVLLLGIAILFLIPLVGGYFWLQQALLPVDPTNQTTQIIVIKKGQSVDKTGRDLKDKGLIRSVWAFKYAVKTSSDTPIQAGSFRLSPAMGTHDIVDQLGHGTLDTWVTILEGWRREEIAAGIEKAFTDKGADFDADTFLALTAGKEGRLFPDTYLFPLDASEETVASILETTFNKKITPQMQKDIEKSGRTLQQVITMASLIEREARDDDARKLVSGILWQRLDNDWPLQVDATLQYALGYDSIQKTWWKPPTAAQKQINSPYNTYAHPGLPPGPIASPSLGSLMAAIYPTPSEYWFYITDTTGRMHYAETIEQHNANIEKYLR